MSIQKNLKPAVLATALVSLAFISSVQADDDFNQSIEQALKFGQADAKYGQIKFNLRFRYDNTDGTNTITPKKTGNAATMRLRLGYLTPEFNGLQGYAEYEGNQDIVANNYNSTRNGKTQYETIADPQQNELNQLWINYKGIPDTNIKVGRQVIDLDNNRFIGAAAWRQLERTFDALLITNTSLPNTTIMVAYLLKMLNTDSTMQGMQMPLVNISYNFADIGKLTGYGYWYDSNERHQDSSQTYGVRFDGRRKINADVSLVYTAEYANQSDYVQSPVAYQADYYHIIGGISTFGVTAKAGMEQLDGKGANKTFDTPLGLLHRFNGWADMFLVTPNNGLRDVYASLEGEFIGVKLTGMYHDFSDDSSKRHYGNEWDFMVTKEFAKHYTLLAKYAYFNAHGSCLEVTTGTASTNNCFDMQKFWLGAEINF